MTRRKHAYCEQSTYIVTDENKMFFVKLLGGAKKENPPPENPPLGNPPLENPPAEPATDESESDQSESDGSKSDEGPPSERSPTRRPVVLDSDDDNRSHVGESEPHNNHGDGRKVVLKLNVADVCMGRGLM